MHKSSFQIIKQVDIKSLTLIGCCLGVFWGIFFGGIIGYVYKGIFEKGIFTIMKGAFLGGGIGLLIGLGLFVLAVSYNFLTTLGVGVRVEVEPVPENLLEDSRDGVQVDRQVKAN